MSDGEELEIEAQQVIEEEEPEVEEERDVVKQDTIAAGLSQIKKTASKYLNIIITI